MSDSKVACTDAVNPTECAKQRLSEAIEGLPADLRCVFVMAALEQKKTTEIAGTLGMSRQQVLELLTKALRLLRECITNGLLESADFKKAERDLYKKWQLRDDVIDR